MFLNILRIPASNVLKTFFNRIVSTGFAFAGYFTFTQTNRKNKYALADTVAGKEAM